MEPKIKAIIPCAGFGKRMNMLPDESKELIINPNNNRPLIDYAFSLCNLYDLEPLVITREEKKDLIEYCANLNIETQIIEPVGEWPDTILESMHNWNKDNILILPDTVLSPVSVIEDIKTGLKLGNNAVIALHDVKDVSKWGSVKDYNIIEKSSNTNEGKAWGLIGFKDYYGYELFSAMSTRNKNFKLDNTGFVYLNEFKDITRTGKIE